jgi:hypothetical protein
VTTVSDPVEKRRMTLTSWLGTVAVAFGLATTGYNLTSNYLNGVRQHALEDKARDDDREALREQVVRLSNRVGALEQIDYKEHPAYALDIYYANGDVERVQVRRR